MSKEQLFKHGLEPVEPAAPQSFMVIKNNNAEGDICFNEHVIKPGEELRLPMAPLPPVGWTGTLNDLVAVDPKKTLAAKHLRETWGKLRPITNGGIVGKTSRDAVWVGHEPQEAVDKDGRKASDAALSAYGPLVTENVTYRTGGSPTLADVLSQVPNPRLREMMNDSGRVVTLYENTDPTPPKTYKRIDKIAKY